MRDPVRQHILETDQSEASSSADDGIDAMSLGKLLRRASSKASDFLTLGSGGENSSILDGEIIFSKNNVCVHPPELLHNVASHHPGYLCVYMEKDESLGTTLILAWVPNSRIQRQDEEALRYITPESSPVRKTHKRSRHVPNSTSSTFHKSSSAFTKENAGDTPNPSKADSLPERNTSDGSAEGAADIAEQGEDERSLDISSDEVSKDSTLDSDSDALSSPFCMSPICEALEEYNSSVFLENESRQEADRHVACYASSPDNLSQCSDMNGRGSPAKWEEQQKLLALEQTCGVFRVDLGQMRSLRLFFSDDACTCGQLVIASRESQYKVFHFHHGGLGKLSEVFQQWKYCREAQLKEKVSEEKTCLHFSIQRPSVLSSESHPEEGIYQRLNVTRWLQHLNEAGQVEEEYKLRKAIFFGGIEPSLRGEVWPFLFGYYSWESASEEREALRVQRREEYAQIQNKRLSMSPDAQKAFWRNVQFTVDKDVVRTDRSNQFFRGEDNPNVEAMRRILLNYAVYCPGVGYSQGMSDLVAPLLTEVLDESDTFWCFVGLMQNTIFISSPCDEDMEKQLMYLRELLRLTHPRFYKHLLSLGEDGLQMLFCHRWILLCFKREFSDSDALRMWESCWAHYQTDYFHLFLCVAIIVLYGEDVIEQQLPTDQMLLHFSNLAMHMNGELVLKKARSLLYQFRLSPKIPCSLHDLCKLCGPGMWDSGYIPAIECTGEHPDSESCLYGGTVEEPIPMTPKKSKKKHKSLDVFTFRK
ncbi:TBC1 domain family member 16 isoform X1 [Bufo bufo]|uniref:TBC1 domain family member 16 isoform X1 n=2 Tax=Bufo bufo TaxID=8384 RepID=UPI001ABDFC6C|nr:TBC1 domain family member 16 isoform X1 [Bufo bufo]